LEGSHASIICRPAKRNVLMVMSVELRGENRITRRKNWPIATLSTTNHTLADLGPTGTPRL